jgi:hypothetical protein
MTRIADRAEQRQRFLDESLRIAVWELLFGTGARYSVEELLHQGARWHQGDLNEGSWRAAAR